MTSHSTGTMQLALRRRWIGLSAVGLALTLLVSGCGSNGGADAEGPVPAGEDASQPATAPGGTAKGGTGLGTITIGDLSHDLTVTRCQTAFATISGAAKSVTEPDNVEVSFEFSPENWSTRPASEGWESNGIVKVDSENPYLKWVTGKDMVDGLNLPGGVQSNDIDITKYDISDDGQSVTGEATFLEVSFRTAQPNPRSPSDDTPALTGSFSFSCPPAG